MARQAILIRFIDLVALYCILEGSTGGHRPRQRDLIDPRGRSGAINEFLKAREIEAWRQKPLTSVFTFEESIRRLRAVGLMEPHNPNKKWGYEATPAAIDLFDRIGDDPHQWPRFIPFSETDTGWIPLWASLTPFRQKPIWASYSKGAGPTRHDVLYRKKSVK